MDTTKTLTGTQMATDGKPGAALRRAGFTPPFRPGQTVAG